MQGTQGPVPGSADLDLAIAGRAGDPIAPSAVVLSAWLALEPGVYWVSVQAIDAGFAGGPWSVPLPFVVP